MKTSNKYERLLIQCNENTLSSFFDAMYRVTLDLTKNTTNLRSRQMRTFERYTAFLRRAVPVWKNSFLPRYIRTNIHRPTHMLAFYRERFSIIQKTIETMHTMILNMLYTCSYSNFFNRFFLIFYFNSLSKR